MAGLPGAHGGSGRVPDKITFKGTGYMALIGLLTVIHTNGIFDEDRLSFWTGFSRS